MGVARCACCAGHDVKTSDFLFRLAATVLAASPLVGCGLGMASQSAGGGFGVFVLCLVAAGALGLCGIIAGIWEQPPS